MSNILIEIKNEYTTHLLNVLTPSIFEGIQTIYNEALKIIKNNKASKLSNNENVLKIFQSFLQAIPKWNIERISEETQRILVTSHSIEWMNNLIKATIKVNLLIFTYSATNKKDNSLYYKDILTEHFIHKIYIECAREIWNNPYLLYHECSPFEIKQNQRECMMLIKECIKEAIRKMLPIKEILEIYIRNDNEINNIMQNDMQNDMQNNMQNDHMNNPELLGGNLEYKVNTTLEEPTINTRILDILEPNANNTNNNYDNTTRNNSPILGGDFSMTSSNIASMLSSEISEKIENIMEHKTDKLNLSSKVDENAFDNKIKKILQKDLGTDSDIETTLNYNTNYQEIFSNSVDKDMEKDKFFKNYLKF